MAGGILNRKQAKKLIDAWIWIDAIFGDFD